MNNVPELLAKHHEEGNRFAALLANFLVDLQPRRIVETGYGVSTLFILEVLDKNDSFLWSVDPKPWFPERIQHPQHEHIAKTSYDALADLYARTGPWDVFLHDSNHDVECMTYELEFGYACLQPGGWIFCDDHSWGQHGAWENFLKTHGLISLKMGSTEYTQKPDHKTPVSVDDVQRLNRHCREFAAGVTEQRRAAGFQVVSGAFG